MHQNTNSKNKQETVSTIDIVTYTYNNYANKKKGPPRKNKRTYTITHTFEPPRDNPGHFIVVSGGSGVPRHKKGREGNNCPHPRSSQIGAGEGQQVSGNKGYQKY